MIKQYSAVYPMPFVGRIQELVDIRARLMTPECRLLTLTGLGGSGKTRLAIEAATTLAPQFPHGAVFVGLQPLARSDLLVPAIAQALGVMFYGEGELQQQLLDYLHDKTLLLILDNFEHLLDGAALLTILLASAPGVTILATSREALHLQEEWLYPLTGLATPPSVYATSVEDYDAVQLFLAHARRLQPHADWATNHEAIIRICELTAGLPLAIELAASWLKGLSIAHIAQEMQRNLDFLSATTRNLEQRHRSMRAVFDQSWEFLSEDERLIFARLSVFPGGFAADAAGQVAGASFAGLAALVEKSLVQMDSSGRFGIHALLRQYGMEQLEAYGETEATYARHSHYFAQLMLRHDTALQQAQQLEAMQAIECDFENIRLAWEWSAKHQQVTQLHTMLNGLYLFGFLGSRYRETTTIFQQTLDQPVADTPLLGRLLARRWGYLHFGHQADYQEALRRIEQALTIAQEQHNQFEIAFCQLMAAYVMLSTQRYADALPHLETSHALFEALNEPYYICWVLHRLGYVYFNLNNKDAANDYTEQSLALARVTQDRVAQATCLYNLGSDSILNGDYVKGKQYCAEALHVASETGHQDQIAHALSLLALCAFCQGDYSTCQDYAERAHRITKDVNLSAFLPYSLALLILLACLREEYAEGVRLSALGKSNRTNMMGLLLLYWARAVLACGVDRPADACVYIQNVLDLSGPHVQSAIITWMVPCATYALAAADPEQAVELLAWVFAYPDSALHWARHWPLLERLQKHLHTMIDHDSYQTHWEKGTALSFDAIATAVQQAFCPASDAGATAAHHQLLTAREQEILGLLAAGLTNPQIAAQLVIGAGTVKTHTLNIYRKLEVANRTQAIIRAQELGLLHA
jgi:predicted ATPase/DNA-binding CsgD family transcriptional regulator